MIDSYLTLRYTFKCHIVFFREAMASKKALYRTIYEDLKEHIMLGAWPKGSQVPPEHILMANYHVSRVTTSHALKLLTKEGLITRHPGKGSFVAGAPPESSEQVAMPSHPVSIPAVGFVLPSLEFSFGPPMLTPLEWALQQQGLALAVACSYGSQEREEEAVTRLWSLGVRGLIVLPVNGQYYNREILRLHLDHFPLVLVDKSLPGVSIPCVATDNRLAAKELTSHLLELGHRRIAFYAPDPFQTSTLRDRFSGYQDAFTAHQLSFDTCLVQPLVGAEQPAAIAHVKTFVMDHPNITAVFAADDDLAMHWTRALNSLGKAVGHEVSVVTFDAHPTDDRPFLTTVVQDQRRLIEEALTILVSQWDNTREPRKSVLLPGTLRIGSSTGPVPASVSPPGH